MIKVRNSIENPLKGCMCGSTLNHWKKFSGAEVRMCMEKDCMNSDIHGASVYKTGTEDSSIYIIPLCKAHGASEQELEILDTCIFISSDPKTTCRNLVSVAINEGEL